MRLLLSYIGRYKKTLFGALLLAVINQSFSLLDPQIFRLIIDRYASHFSSFTRAEFISGVGLLILASVGVAFVSRVAKNFQDYFVTVITQRVGATIYADNISHSFSLPYAVFEDQRSGELLQKLEKARDDSQRLIQSFINTVFLALVGMVIVIAYALYVSWPIGVVYFLIIPILGSTLYFITKRIKEIQKQIVAETASLAGSTTETLRNVELVKSLGLEQQETKRLNAVNNIILGLELKKARMIRVLAFMQGTAVNLCRAGILLLMLWLVFQQKITLGELFSLYIYSFLIFTPLQEFGNVSSQYQETRASMDQVAKILEIKPESKPAQPKEIGTVKSIVFEDVSFAYASGVDNAVENISFSLASGDTIAFVGPSGSGKSTLLKLIVGLYPPTSGMMQLNGIDRQHIDFEKVRKRIGYVSQETQLFAGTVRENLLFVRPDATDTQCLQALKQAEALPIIERGAKGLETRIGGGGIKISGGERQRLAIARALLREPDVLIFDEATSSPDSITEKAITEDRKS